MAPSGKAPLGILHFVEQTVYKAEKALVAAKFNGLQLEKRKFNPAEQQNPDFLAKNPTGKVPFLETDMGVIFTSNSIARAVARCRADTSLYGNCFDDEGLIDTWLEFCTHELEVPLMTWVYPTMGIMEDNPKATAEAKEDVKKALKMLETQLAKSKYLIGDFITLADISVVCALKEGFQRVFDPAFRKLFPKVSAWFEGCCALPQFKAVFTLGKMCAEAAKPVPVKKEFMPPPRKDAAAPKAAAAPAPAKEAKADKKKAEKPAAAAAPAAAPAAGGDVEAAVAKVKAIGDDIRKLKDKLKAEGQSGKKINEDPGIMKLVKDLTEWKVKIPADYDPAAAAPAAAKAPASGGYIEAKVTAKGDEIRVLKEKLKGEGLSGKKMNDHEELKKLVAELQELKKLAEAAGASPSAAAKASPKASPKAAPAPAAAASDGDIAAKVTAVGDEIRTLKEKLKAEGLSGKKINDHAEVKAKVAELQELKAKLPA